MAWVGDEGARGAITLGPVQKVGGGWSLGSEEFRELGLWVDELFMRFGKRVGVRAALAALDAWLEREGPIPRPVRTGVEACRAWLDEPSERRAAACDRAGDRLGEPQGPESEGTWVVIRLCGAIASRYPKADIVFSLTSAASALVHLGSSLAQAEALVRAAVRDALVPWALETRHVVVDAETLRERALCAVKEGDAAGGAELASRGIAADERDPLSWFARAEARRATRDLRGALGDLERCAKLDPRGAAPLRLRGLILADLGERVPAMASLMAYLDRVEVQITRNGVVEVRRPPEAEEARQTLDRLAAG